ncbi:hypothetical protein [Ammoniphilus sp. CFH 90114]|uniref:hypothetical protein n=1 Tax=Ammoniphilus sp. CFH 90114 TaxID=2493665 RepID=UPI0010251EAE|nr:hypothetical protein [Ammoniphilus sp. CFH 90114]RXT02365.1 hypothetical protein EIZ39_24655 [Ammoniphilus sp. CFH 90114]
MRKTLLVFISTFLLCSSLHTYAEEGKQSSLKESMEQARIKEQQYDEKKMKRLANQLGIDIQGLNRKQAVQAILEAKKLKAITLREKQLLIKLGVSDRQKLAQELEQKQRQTLNEMALRLDVDITNLSNKEARELLKKLTEERRQAQLETLAARLQVDITGLEHKEAKEKLKQAIDLNKWQFVKETAQKLEVDIEGLAYQEALKLTKTELKKEQRKKLEQLAAQLHIRIKGLSNEEALELVKKAQK